MDRGPFGAVGRRPSFLPGRGHQRRSGRSWSRTLEHLYPRRTADPGGPKPCRSTVTRRPKENSHSQTDLQRKDRRMSKVRLDRKKRHKRQICALQSPEFGGILKCETRGTATRARESIRGGDEAGGGRANPRLQNGASIT